MSFTKFNYTKDKVQCQENGSCILTMNKNEIIMFSGYVRIHVTKGKIKINGYIINATTNNDDESNYYNLYSIPYWKHNCLSIKSLINSQIHLYRFDFISKYQIKQSPQTCDSIFNITGCHFFLNKLTSHQYQPLSIPLSWEKSSNYFVESSNINNTIMICGRTQTGKSTYSNYLINSLLNKYSQIAYLDCDIGQSEFNPEGIISITIINYPLFGASHTHQHNMKNIDKYYKCLKSYYYGSNNPMDNPEFYLQCIYKLYSHWIEFVSLKNKNIPLIINTLGWTKSLGSNILKSLIINISPNNLIEIHDKNEPLFSSIEMGYLSEVKDMFIQQNKIHNWCDNNYKLNKKNKLNNNNNNNNSLVNSWWKQLTTNDEFSIKEYKELKPNQKKWFKYLNNLVELKFQSDNQNINHNAKWYNNINISNDKLCKTNQEMQLFKAFINAHVHYIKSVSKKIFENNNLDNNDERIKNMIKLRKDRQKITIQKRILSMISYFTQELFLNKPAKYLREIDCYKIGFNDISIMFLEENMDINKNKNLILHALDGVIVGLGVMNHKLNDNMLEINEPPLKKMKYNKLNMDNDNNNDMKWDLNVINNNYENNNNDIECVGLGIIRSINVKKQLFYLITPVMISELNKVNLFIRGRTRIPSMLIYDESILTPPFYINSIPVNERILKTTC